MAAPWAHADPPFGTRLRRPSEEFFLFGKAGSNIVESVAIPLTAAISIGASHCYRGDHGPERALDHLPDVEWPSWIFGNAR
jgi:hypothetical protein